MPKLQKRKCRALLLHGAENAEGVAIVDTIVGTTIKTGTSYSLMALGVKCTRDALITKNGDRPPLIVAATLVIAPIMLPIRSQPAASEGTQKTGVATARNRQDGAIHLPLITQHPTITPVLGTPTGGLLVVIAPIMLPVRPQPAASEVLMTDTSVRTNGAPTTTVSAVQVVNLDGSLVLLHANIATHQVLPLHSLG